MNQDDNINIKLEILKDKFSGNISVLAHFSHTAPNIYKDSEGYIWYPTKEEKNFLTEAFELTASCPDISLKEKTAPPLQPKREIPPSTEPKPVTNPEPKLRIHQTEPARLEEEPRVTEERQKIYTPNYEKQQDPTPDYPKPKVEEIKREQPTRVEEFPKTQPREKPPVVFNAPSNNKTYQDYKEVETSSPNKDQEQKQESYLYSYNEKKEVKDAVVSEKDLEAIDAALKKQTEKDDMDQADEKTIVDKVLNQKKKVRWNRH